MRAGDDKVGSWVTVAEGVGLGVTVGVGVADCTCSGDGVGVDTGTEAAVAPWLALGVGDAATGRCWRGTRVAVVSVSAPVLFGGAGRFTGEGKGVPDETTASLAETAGAG